LIPFSGFELLGGLFVLGLLASIVPDIFENKIFFQESSHKSCVKVKRS